MDLKTKDFYSKNLITVNEWETPERALKIMKNNFIRHLPVIDAKSEEIIGIVSDRDLIGDLSKPELVVKDLMSRKVLAFDLKAPLKTIVDEMIDKKVSSFLLKDRHVYCGIITTEDMLHVLSMVLGDQEEGEVLDLIPFFKFKYPATMLA